MTMLVVLAELEGTQHLEEELDATEDASSAQERLEARVAIRISSWLSHLSVSPVRKFEGERDVAGEDSAEESSVVSGLESVGQSLIGFGVTTCHDASNDQRP